MAKKMRAFYVYETRCFEVYATDSSAACDLVRDSLTYPEIRGNIEKCLTEFQHIEAEES